MTLEERVEKLEKNFEEVRNVVLDDFMNIYDRVNLFEQLFNLQSSKNEQLKGLNYFTYIFTNNPDPRVVSALKKLVESKDSEISSKAREALNNYTNGLGQDEKDDTSDDEQE